MHSYALVKSTKEAIEMKTIKHLEAVTDDRIINCNEVSPTQNGLYLEFGVKRKE